MKETILASRRPKRLLSKLALAGERGMTTAEYAVGTVAVIGLGGLLIKIFTDPVFRQILTDLIARIIALANGAG